MNAFEAAATNGKEDDLHAELDALFNEQNTSNDGVTSIPATFLRVTVSEVDPTLASYQNEVQRGIDSERN